VVDTAEGFRPTADEAGVALVVVEPEAMVPSMVDPDRLAQAVANLLEHARKHATSEVRVETTAGPAGEVTVVISDDGPGIAPTHLPHVFERLDVTDRPPRRQVGGTGLGLAIVRQLTVGMGASATAESPARPDGRGARFVLQFPPAPPGPTAASRPPAQGPDPAV
jgi:signal transduction histidine kinase